MEGLRLGGLLRVANVDRSARLVAIATVVVALSVGAMTKTDSADASLKAINAKYHLVSDGSRFVAYQKPDGTAMVFDSYRGKVRKIRGSEGCEPSAVGYRLVLVNCAHGYYEDFKASRLASVWTGKSREVPGATKNEDYRFGDIGKYWVRADCQSPSPCYGTTYTNYRTGTQRYFTTVGLPPSVPDGLGYSDLDLDNRHLGRFKPHPGFSIFNEDFNWVTYIGFGAHYYLLNQGDGMFLVRSPRVRVKIGGYLPGTDSILDSRIIARGSGRIAWLNGRWLRAYDLRSGQKILRRLPRKASRLALIERGAVVAFPTGQKKGGKSVMRLRIIGF